MTDTIGPKRDSDTDGINEEKWIACPICRGKTRLRVRNDTVLINFPLYCPKCRQESLINVKRFCISVVKEPDAYTNLQ